MTDRDCVMMMAGALLLVAVGLLMDKLDRK